MIDGPLGGIEGIGGIGGIDGSGAGAEGPSSACGLGDLHAIGPHEVAASGVAGTAGAAGEGMILEIGGEYFDLGPGTGDADGDGAADSVTLADDRGLSIYSDIDGDGTVDHVTTVLFDGTYETWRSSSAAADDGAESSGGTPSGVSPGSDAKQESPSTWGIHEWERGERGRWA